MKASNIIKLTDSLGKQQFGELRQFILENRLEIPQNVRNFLNAVGTISISENGKLHHGNTFETVYYFEDHNVYLSISGWYSSFLGMDFEDAGIKEVTPKQKTITIFE